MLDRYINQATEPEGGRDPVNWGQCPLFPRTDSDARL